MAPTLRPLLMVSFLIASCFGRRLKLPTFEPEPPSRFFLHALHDEQPSSPSFLPPDDPNTAKTTQKSVEKVARDFLWNHWKLSGEDYRVTDVYRSGRTGITHFYARQIVDGLDVENGDLNLNIVDGKVVSVGCSFFGIDAKKTDDLTPTKRIYKRDQIVFKLPELHIGPLDALMTLLDYIKLPKPSQTTLSLDEILSASKQLLYKVIGLKLSKDVFNEYGYDILVKRSYLAVDNALEPVYTIHLPLRENHLNAYISRKTGLLLGLIDYVHGFDEDHVPEHSSYRVYPLGTDGPSAPREDIFNPAHPIASPLGWHETGINSSWPEKIRGGDTGLVKKGRYSDTTGNNVLAQENWDDDGSSDDDTALKFEKEQTWPWPSKKPVIHRRADGGENLTFHFPINFQKHPRTYVDAALTNLFYWCNIMHDIFYVYGFDEVAGNFQQNNFGRGGRGGDAVIAYAQDGAGTNNANFGTPPDGYHGTMRMYVWDLTQPNRDGDLLNSIIVHEYGHGISTRLTGGPMNSNCLSTGQARAMGEGYGDVWAVMLRMQKEYTRFLNYSVGSYVMGGRPSGVRRYPYSTDLIVNPSTYGFLKKPGYGEEHAGGEVWASILLEVFWNLVDDFGFSDDWYNPKAKSLGAVSNATSPAGNLVMLQLMVDGLKLQPCRPSFIDARDAMLQADQLLFSGQHMCQLWHGFAKRGLGADAQSSAVEDFTVPSEYQTCVNK